MQTNNELYHYGVLGMKWGVRRYRNKYGVLTKAGAVQSRKLKEEYDNLAEVKTLTPKGIQRKARLAEEYKELTGKSINPPRTTQKKLTTNDESEIDNVKNMSNEELQARNFRRQLENTYLSNLSRVDKQSTLNMIEIGKKRVQDLTNDELQAYNTRKQLENTYLSFVPKPEVSRGKKFISDAIDKAIIPGTLAAGKKYTENQVLKLLSKLGEKDAAKDIVNEVKDAVK